MAYNATSATKYRTMEIIAFKKLYQLFDRDKISNEIAQLHFSFINGSETLQNLSWQQFNFISTELENELNKLNADNIKGNVIAFNSVESLYSVTCISAILSSGSTFFPVDLHSVTCQSSKAIFANNIELAFKILEIKLFLSPTLFCNSCFRFLESISFTTIQLPDSLKQFGLSLFVRNERQQLPHTVSLGTDSLAYVIQTSGSTGQPKLVFVPYSSMMPNVIAFKDLLRLDHRDVIWSASPLTFDPSALDLFISCSTGATILTVSRATKLNLPALLQVLCEQHVTVFQCTPSLLLRTREYDLLKRTIFDPTRSHVRAVLFGGEPFPSIPELKRCSPDPSRPPLQFFNLYGVTELSVWASVYRVTDDDWRTEREIPLGDPLPETDLKLVPVNGGDGDSDTDSLYELHVGSATRVCAVLEPPFTDSSLQSLTFPTSASDPTVAPVPTFRDTGDVVWRSPNGELFFRGRSDGGVKRLGKKLSLFALEQRVRTLTFQLKEGNGDSDPPSAVAPDAAIALAETTRAETLTGIRVHLVLAFPHADAEALVGAAAAEAEARVWRELRRSLPADQLPDCLHLRSSAIALPVSAHEKLDRRALLESLLSSSTASSDATDDATSVEEHSAPRDANDPLSQLETLWEELTGSRPTRDSTFASAGGNSFAAVHLQTRLELVTGRPLPALLNALFTQSYCDVRKCVRDSLVASDSGSTSEQPAPPPLQSASASASKRALTSAESSADPNSESESEGSTRAKHSRLELGVAPARDPLVTAISRFFPRPSFVESELFPGAVEPATDVRLERREGAVTLEVAWSYNLGKCIDASPLLLLVAESERHPETASAAAAAAESDLKSERHLVYVGSHAHRFACVELESGRRLWEAGGDGDGEAIGIGGRIESSACVSRCGRFVAVGCYDGALYVFGRATGALHWRYATGGEVKSSPAVDPRTGLLYFGSHDRHLYCVDIERRELVWRSDTPAFGGIVFASPCVVQRPAHLVLAASLSGTLAAFEPTTGRVRWSLQIGKPLFSTPVACETLERVLVGCVDARVYCASLADGAMLWTLLTGGPIYSSASVLELPAEDSQADDSDGAVCTAGLTVGAIGSHDASLYLFDVRDGLLLSRLAFDSALYAVPSLIRVRYSPIAASRSLIAEYVVCSTAGTVSLVEARFETSATGSPTEPEATTTSKRSCSVRTVANSKLSGELFGSPVCFLDKILVGCRNDNLYCLTLKTDPLFPLVDKTL